MKMKPMGDQLLVKAEAKQEKTKKKLNKFCSNIEIYSDLQIIY